MYFNALAAIFYYILVNSVIMRFRYLYTGVLVTDYIVSDNGVLHVYTQHYTCSRIVVDLISINGYILAVYRTNYAYVSIVAHRIIANEYIVSSCMWIYTVFNVFIHIVIFNYHICYFFRIKSVPHMMKGVVS